MNNIIEQPIGIDNAYLVAVIGAFKEFLKEETLGHIYSELRLKDTIEKARKQFSKERNDLSKIIIIKDSEKRTFDRFKERKGAQHGNI